MVPITHIRRNETHRLIPSIFPPTGIFDDVASPEDLADTLEIEAWTNDRLSSEYGVLLTIPLSEWVVGIPHATVVMAAYCHPSPEGGRFNDNSRGAWYAAFDLQTAFRETIFHRTKELDEIGVYDTFVHMRQYLADFNSEFHDVRTGADADRLHDGGSYVAGQKLAAQLLRRGSNGVCYRSVRHESGECIACFRPRLVLNVRPAAHFEYRWEGSREPRITELVT
jgi:hypothetical protein